MTEPSNPFVSRVMVNRVWQHLLGRGIVASVDNFGVLGDQPSHPELLDYLSGEFIRDEWSVKRLIRRIMLSSTYQMSSLASERSREIDPKNLLWQHMPIRRLEGEAIRDSILQISGRLDRRQFGPSVEVHLTAFMEGRGRPGASGPLDGDGRRSIYVRVRRNFLSPMMTAFDTPLPFNTTGRRAVSNLPAQALILLNDPLVVEQAHRWAHIALGRQRRIAARADHEDVRNGLRSAADRRPSWPTRDFPAAARGAVGTDASARLTDERVWADLCHVLFNVKEFIFIN